MSDSAFSNSTVNYTQISAVGAQRLVDAAVAEAAQRGLALGVAVVDTEGMLKAFARMDGAPAIVIEATQAKARAALMGLGSGELGQMMLDNLPNLVSVATLGGMTLLGGGLPIRADGRLIGAIGVGGASTEDDLTVAEVALKALIP